MKSRSSALAKFPDRTANCAKLYPRILQAKWVSFVLFASLLSSGCCLAYQEKSVPVFWSGESEGFKIVWTHSDLLVTKGPTRVFSAGDFARRGLAHFVAVGKEPGSGKMQSCSYDRHFRLLGVAGTLVSFRDEYYASCAKEAHPGGETRFTTINLAKPGLVAYSGQDAFGFVDPARAGKIVRLNDLFTDGEIYTRLRTDVKISNLLAQDGGRPEDVKDLAGLLDNLSGKVGERPDCFSIPADFLTRFAVRGVTGTDMVIEVGLPGTGPCREQITPIVLRFPMSDSVRTKIGVGAIAAMLYSRVGTGETGDQETVIRQHTR